MNSYLLSGGRQVARKLKRAQILLAADAAVGDEEIAASVGVGGSTVYRTNGDSWRQPGAGSEREVAPWRQTQVDRQGGGLAAIDRLRKPAGEPRPMDAEPARRRDGQADCARELIARDGAAALRRRRSQAVAPKYVVHPAGRRRLRRPHGGRARSLCRSAGPAAASALLRRDPNPAHRRDAPADPARARAARALRLRVRRNGTANLFVFLDANRLWRKLKVTARRTAIDFASACANSLTSIIRKPNASASCSTICRLIRPVRSIRPSRPSRRDACFAASSSTTFPSTPAGSTCSSRDRLPRRPMPGPSHRKLSAPHRRSRRLGESAQCRPRPHRLELHNRKGPHQNGASLYEAHKPKTPAKNQNLCAEELVAS